MIGDVVVLYGCIYGFIVGNGLFFESVVVVVMVEFMFWLDCFVNKSWCVFDDCRVIGIIIIDGEDFEGNVVYLCWFILFESLCG